MPETSTYYVFTVSLLYTYYVFTTSLLEKEKEVFWTLEWHIREKDIFNTPRSHHFFFFREESLMIHPFATAAFRDSSFFTPSSSLHLCPLLVLVIPSSPAFSALEVSDDPSR